MATNIPNDFGLVLGAIGATWITNYYLMMKVGSARKQYGIKYPALYAPPGHKDEEAFNNVQRGHQNYLEAFAAVQIMVLVNGVISPKPAAVCGFVYAIGSFIKGKGYAEKGPDGRMFGGLIAHLGDLPLLVMTLYNAYAIYTQ